MSTPSGGIRSGNGAERSDAPELSDPNVDDITPFDELTEDLDPDALPRFQWGFDHGFRLGRRRPYRKDEHDAITRRWLAYWVLGIVSALYGAAVLGMLCHWIDVEELGRVALVLGPIQALAAAVLGFYFGRDNKTWKWRLQVVSFRT